MAIQTYLTNNRPEAVAFAFGRVFYAGTQAARWSTTLFFSQVMLDDNRAGKCYQDADPTAEEINALIDTDGGVITIPDVGRVLRLIPLTNTLVVVASNGVWTITGGDGGFTPINYFVNKVTEIGCISKRSVITVEDGIIYCAEDGLYQIGSNEQGKVGAINITEEKIDSFFNAIPYALKEKSISIYDYKTKEFSWYYGDNNDVSGSLNLRLRGGKWYPYSFDTDSETLPAKFYMAIPFYSPRSREGIGTKFLVYSADGDNAFYTINEFADGNFNDFGVAPIDAYMVTTAMTLDNPQFDKQAMYATFYFDITESSVNGLTEDGELNYVDPSSCLMTPSWSWATSNKLGKQGRQRQIYRLPDTPLDADGTFDIGTDVLVVRERIRGQGKALQFDLQTEPNKDMRLIGYTVNVNMEGAY